MTEHSLEEMLNLIKRNNIKSINVCGSPGSGKTTLAKNLALALGFEVFDLDTFFYDVRCNRISKEQDRLVLSKILDKKNYILDGTYSSTLKYRSEKIDLFIFIKSNVWRCLYRFLKRRITSTKRKCGEKITWKTLNLILKYKTIEAKIFADLIPNQKLIIYTGK